MPTWLAIVIGIAAASGIVWGAIAAGIAVEARARRRRSSWLPHPADHQPEPSISPQSGD